MEINLKDGESVVITRNGKINESHRQHDEESFTKHNRQSTIAVYTFTNGKCTRCGKHLYTEASQSAVRLANIPRSRYCDCPPILITQEQKEQTEDKIASIKADLQKLRETIFNEQSQWMSVACGVDKGRPGGDYTSRVIIRKGSNNGENELYQCSEEQWQQISNILNNKITKPKEVGYYSVEARDEQAHEILTWIVAIPIDPKFNETARERLACQYVVDSTKRKLVRMRVHKADFEKHKATMVAWKGYA